MKLKNILYAILGALVTILMLGKSSVGSNKIYLPLVMKNSSGDQPGLTSIGLIEKDLAAGILDANTAAIYEVYTLLPNSPLPPQYVGAPDPQVDIAPFHALWGVYASLSSDQKAAVDPYLRRPDDQTSAYFIFQQEQPLQQAVGSSITGSLASDTRPPDTIQWTSLVTQTGVKIHYRKDISGDDVRATGVGAAIDTRIYSSLNTLMGRVWLDDTGCEDGGVVDDGGSGSLDIYLMHGIEDRGVEISCHDNPTPGWVMVNADRPIGDDTNIGMVQTSAHEMFHAIQDSYAYKQAVGSYLWVQEATAKWVEDYVYHNAQSEWDYAYLYLGSTLAKTDLPMDIIPAGSNRYYGEYLWPFYLYRVKNRPSSFMRSMFENAASYPSTDIFMVSAGSDDPVTLFPDFAVKNWNQAPFDDYQKVDSGMSKRVGVQYRTTISGLALPEKTPYLLSGTGSGNSFKHLSATYWDFVFSDATARTVAFYNGLSNKVSNAVGLINFIDNKSVFYQTNPLDFSQYKGMNVEALIKINDAWTQEDWSMDSSKLFCRDRKAQNLQELVLIITNSNFKDSQANYTYTPVDQAPILEVSPTACYQWKGSFDVADTSDPGVTHTVTGNVTFESSASLFGPDVFFNVKSGSAYLTMQGESSDHVTRYHASGWADFNPSSDPSSYLDTYNLVTGGPHPNAYYGFGQTNATVAGTEDWCCDENEQWVTGEPADFAIGKWFIAPDPLSDQLNSQSTGNTISGSYTEPNGYITYHWNFTAQTEP